MTCLLARGCAAAASPAELAQTIGEDLGQDNERDARDARAGGGAGRYPPSSTTSGTPVSNQ